MSQSDHTECVDNLSSSALKFVAGGGFTTPPGGGSFCGAWKSLTASVGLSTRFFNGAGLVPAPKGGYIQAALRRGISAGPTGCAVFVCLCLGGTANTNSAYMLGISDGETPHLVLRKGQLVGGLPDVAPGTQGVLWRSTDVIAIDAWAHVKLMAAVNTNGDTVLSVWQNDLTVIGASVLAIDQNWVQVPGINLLNVSGSGITDDAAGINTGSASLTSGRFGWGCWVGDVNRVAYIDHIEGVAQS